MSVLRLERFTLARWFAIVVACLLAAAVAVMVAGLVALANLTRERRLLADRIDPAAISTVRLGLALVDEETGVRGYALTGEPRFLEPYRRGRRLERAALASLDDLTRHEDLAGVRGDVEGVREQADAWRERYALPATGALDRGGSPPEVGAGKKLFDLLRMRLQRLDADLAARRARAREDLASAAGAVRALFLTGGLLLVFFVLAAAWALRETVVRPLTRLARDVRRVAAGDFSRPLRAGGPRDVAALGRDVDIMRARIVEELTSLREAEAALVRQAAELQRSNTELEQFAYVASHDLQEPLRKVAAFTQMLQRRYEGRLDEKAHAYIEFAVDGAKRMQDLINDLLAFSRVGRGGRPHDRLDCNVLLEQATANLSAVIEETGAEVRAEGLPSVEGDATLLTGVFQNLIGNAVKFRRPDRQPAVRVEAERADGEWAFRLTDNGIGIDPEYAERIFVIFQRLHGREAYVGTGIGLAMCRKIIEYHGGRIWLGPPPAEGGSTFCFTLPADDQEDHPA